MLQLVYNYLSLCCSFDIKTYSSLYSTKSVNELLCCCFFFAFMLRETFPTQKLGKYLKFFITELLSQEECILLIHLEFNFLCGLIGGSICTPKTKNVYFIISRNLNAIVLKI